MSSRRSVIAESARVLDHDASALLTVVLLAGFAVLIAACLPRRRVTAALAGVSLAVAVGLTIVPFGGWSRLGFETGALRSIATNLEPHRSALWNQPVNADGPANVALFLPAGLFVALLLRRPLLTAVALTGMSFAIECWQATLTTRVGSFDDVVANALGAAAGAVLAAVVLGLTALARRPTTRHHGAPADRLSRVG
jgi:glycopeptide antibiotics resistance protein